MMSRVSVLIGVGVAALSSCTPVVPHYEFPHAELRATLPNGLRVIVMPDDSTPLVEVDIRYHTGSNQDPPGKAGIAHFVEHMQFQYRIFGPDKPPIFDVLPQITTFFNAFTSTDATHYMLQGRKEELQAFLRLEAARMVGDCRGLPPEEFEREREVVRNELRQRYGRPEAEIPRIIQQEAYPKGHPYHYLGIGDDEQLANITQEDVCQFIDEYYVPQNATLIVAGNVDPDRVRDEVVFAFGAIDKGLGPDGKPRAVKKNPIPMPEIHYRRVVHELPVERESIHFVWALPPRYSDEGARATNAFLLGALVDQFNEEWDFAYDVAPQLLGGDEAPLMVLSVEPKPGKLGQAEEFVWKSVKRLPQFFFDPGGAFEEQKNSRLASLIAGFEDLNARTTAVGTLAQARADFPWDSEKTLVFEEFQRTRNQNPGDSRDVVKDLITKDKALVVVIRRNENAEGFKAADLKFETKSHAEQLKPLIDPAEARRPLLAPTDPSVLVKARRFQLDNGMRVVLLPKGSRLPVVAARLIFDVGAAHEPDGLEGIASLAARQLNHPRGSQIGLLGADWGASVDDDTTTFSVSGISIYTSELLTGLERKLKIGYYSQDAVEQWQKRMRQAFELRPVRQQRAFTREVAMAVWGPNHPYAIKGMPTRESVGRIGYDELEAFRRKHYTAANATLVVAGNFDEKTAEKVIRDTFGAWDRGHKDEPVTAPAQPGAGARAIGVIGDKLPQVQVAIQYPGPAGVDGQQAARMVLAEMLRLQQWTIRTTLGSTYGIQVYRQLKVGPSRYIMQGGVQSERAGETLRMMRDKIDELRRGDNFDLVFAEARRTVLQRLLSQSTVSRQLAAKLGLMATYHQPPDYFDKLVQYVAALSPAQVRALIESELRPENEVIAILGDRETIEKAFAEAGITTVKYVDVSQ